MSLKKSDDPKFETKWWKTNQPKGLTKAGALETALSGLEAAEDRLNKSHSEDDWDICVVAIGKVRQAVEAVISEADKGKKSPPKGATADEMNITSDVLKKFARMYDSKKKDLEKEVKEDEADDNVFTNATDFKKYLLKMLRKVGNAVLPDRPADAPDNWEPEGGLNFAVALGKKAGDHRMAISKSKGGAGLDGQLKKASGLHVSTFGTLFQDKETPEAMVLSLTGKQLPGLAKKVDRMLKIFKPLPYTHTILMVGGKEVDDLNDPDDVDVDDGETQPNAQDPVLGQLRAMFEKISPSVTRLIQAGGPHATQFDSLAKHYQVGMLGSDVVSVKKALDGLIALMRQAAAEQQGGGKGPINYAQLLDGWVKACSDAQSGVQKLRGAILEEFKNEEELPAIQRNITKLDAIMTTLGNGLQQMLEAAQLGSDSQKADLNKLALEEARRAINYVTSDQLIAAVQDNPFTPVDLRGTLSEPLQRIETALAA